MAPKRAWQPKQKKRIETQPHTLVEVGNDRYRVTTCLKPLGTTHRELGVWKFHLALFV